MGVKIKFDTKKFERDIKSAIEKDLRKHPEQVLNNHKGESLNSACPKCGSKTLKIISGGKAKCSSCNATINIDINVNWK